jgi:hypothetical protein
MLRLALKCVAYFLIVLCVADIIPMYWVLGDTQAMEFVYYADMPIGTIGLWLKTLTCLADGRCIQRRGVRAKPRCHPL